MMWLVLLFMSIKLLENQFMQFRISVSTHFLKEVIESPEKRIITNIIADLTISNKDM